MKVQGDFACFTRPEHHVERMSYDVMTPTAARGILESILWKPEFRWIITEIRVLKPINHFVHGFYSPRLGSGKSGTGVTEKDLALVWEALQMA